MRKRRGIEWRGIVREGHPIHCGSGGNQKDNLSRLGGGLTVRTIWQSKALRISGVICQALLAVVIVGILFQAYVQQQVPVGLIGLTVFTDYWDKGYVGLRGTWVIEREKQLFPLQVSEIGCRLAEKTCVESRAEISDTTLKVEQDTHEILSWDEHTLVYGNNDAICTNYIYTVSRDTKQVSGLRTIKPGMESTCTELSKELKLRLADGFPVYWEMVSEARPVAASMAALGVILIWTVLRVRTIIKHPPKAD